jgi:uncharacterized membrane protein YeaQ/YmgE (transglycosylase-associated protein family)
VWPKWDQSGTTNEGRAKWANLIATLFIGLIAGWIAGRIVTGNGFGLVADILVGIVGAFFGGWLFRHAGIYIGAGLISSIISATVGAIVLLGAARCN